MACGLNSIRRLASNAPSGTCEGVNYRDTYEGGQHHSLESAVGEKRTNNRMNWMNKRNVFVAIHGSPKS